MRARADRRVGPRTELPALPCYDVVSRKGVRGVPVDGPVPRRVRTRKAPVQRDAAILVFLRAERRGCDGKNTVSINKSAVIVFRLVSDPICSRCGRPVCEFAGRGITAAVNAGTFSVSAAVPDGNRVFCRVSGGERHRHRLAQQIGTVVRGTDQILRHGTRHVQRHIF